MGFIRWWIEHLTKHVTNTGWFRMTNYKLLSVYLIPKMHCFNDPIDTTDNLEPEKSEPQTILTFYSQSMNHTLWFHSDLRSLILDDFYAKNQVYQGENIDGSSFKNQFKLKKNFKVMLIISSCSKLIPYWPDAHETTHSFFSISSRFHYSNNILFGFFFEE